MKLLHQKGGEINITKRNSVTPIGLAAQHGHEEVVEFLVKNTSAAFINKGFPLKWAAKKGHVGVVKRLLQHPEINSTIEGVDWREIDESIIQAITEHKIEKRKRTSSKQGSL